jgi:uncharacterized OB-fold protein
MAFEAYRCQNGHVTYPGHRLCPECGAKQDETVDLSDETAEIVTWTESTATPPGVREPNTLAIVEFTVDGESVRALGQIGSTDDDESFDVETGDEVEPVYVEELRKPGVGLKPVDADQEWDGYRFRPVQ